MVKRLIRKIFSIKEEWKFAYLIKQGNLKVGVNCDLSKFSVSHNSLINGNCNIEIGDNCQIWGNIVLHDRHSKVKIGNRVFIGDNTMINCKDEIEIGDDVLISWDCIIIDSNSHALDWENRTQDVIDWKEGPERKCWDHVITKKVTISEKCWVGLRSIILKDVFLSPETIVAAGSVVTKNTQPKDIVGGNPARIINRKDLSK